MQQSKRRIQHKRQYILRRLLVVIGHPWLCPFQIPVAKIVPAKLIYRRQRLVIFNLRGTTALSLQEWKHVVENQWGTLHPVRACRERSESKAWKSEDRSLYLLNYFPMFNLSFDNSYKKINTEGLDTFLKRALSEGLDTGSNKTLLPTFVCIDYVDIGNGLDHVTKINALKGKQRLSLTQAATSKI